MYRGRLSRRTLNNMLQLFTMRHHNILTIFEIGDTHYYNPTLPSFLMCLRGVVFKKKHMLPKNRSDVIIRDWDWRNWWLTWNSIPWLGFHFLLGSSTPCADCKWVCIELRAMQSVNLCAKYGYTIWFKEWVLTILS